MADATSFARLIDAIPIVATSAIRDILFANAAVNQRVQNLETQYVERWTGITWTLDIAMLGASRVFDVAGYPGAFIDGVTSDQGAIDAAYAAAVAAGGGVLHFRPGSWRGSVSISTSAIAVRGAGPAYTTLKQLDATYRSVSDAAMTTGLPTLTSATAAFTSADVKKTVFVQNAGRSTGEDFIAKILSVESSTSCTLDTNAGQTVSGKTGRIGCGRNVVEFGTTYLGNFTPATSNGGISDITIDGNKANVSAPANSGDDLVLNGVEFTNHSFGYVRNVRIQNCHNAGLNPVIASDYIDVSGLTVTGCSNVTTGLPGVDLNSSSYGRYRGVLIQNCYYGMRILDNCNGNDVDVLIRQTNAHGLICDAQSSNLAHGNKIRAVIHEAGVSNIGSGFYLGRNWDGNEIDVVVAFAGCSYSANIVTGLYDIPGALIGSETFSDADKPRGNKIKIVAFKNGGAGVLLRANRNVVDIVATENCQKTALGNYALDIGGSYNHAVVSCIDENTKQRGIAVRAVGGEVGTAATQNQIHILQRNPSSPLDDTGTQTGSKTSQEGIKSRAETTGNVNIAAGQDVQIQRWTAALTGNMSVTFTGNPVKGDRFEIVRADGSSAFTMTVNTAVPVVIPNSTKARVVAEYDGASWVEIGYGVLL